MTDEKTLEILTDFLNAVESACVNSRRQISEIVGVTEKKQAAVKEETFASLKFEPQEGAKIGAYDVAYKQNNLESNWNSARNILRQSNATINRRYHGEGYVFSYWLFGEGKIYRQKLKPKA